ncbi:hypothetical protein [Arcticibacter tournemirensis]|uniref:Uncharacterized protein n=1 Tax=Arcticibacter tournemirensis TaxID=699437 RepID=A0A4Q0M3T2_9SPHI|nr:hypothetical protein [Arcticibacter tournemirensis]RXF67581.1 hypothetical protein EKH83_18525 [Arcticibacter tournemirensis]
MEKYTYKGLVTQDDFNLRFGFCQSRIAIGYTLEEASFLMGKHPYFYGEYEEMRDGTKLSESEKTLLCSVFKTQLSSPINFERDEFGYDYKRIIKGEREDKQGIYHYTIHHPWLIRIEKGNNVIKKNFPITYREFPFRLGFQPEREALALFDEAVNWLLRISFFQHPQSPLQIYERIRLTHHNPIFRPCYLKKILYRLMAEKSLQMKTINGKIHYTTSI